MDNKYIRMLMIVVFIGVCQILIIEAFGRSDKAWQRISPFH